MRNTITSKTCARRALGIAVGIMVIVLLMAGGASASRATSKALPSGISDVLPQATTTTSPGAAVWAWGNNWNGQLGDGTISSSQTPVQAKLPDGTYFTGVTAIAAGTGHTVALKNDGTVWAWGYNGDGQLGDGTTTKRDNPVQVSGFTNATAITAGSYYTVALKNDGTVWAWGDNSNGQLGDGTTIPSHTPVQVWKFTDVTAIAAGRTAYTVALKNDGTVWAWGDNSNGQLGDGTTTDRITPVQVRRLTGVTAIAAGYTHTVALKNDGTVWAWGSNDAGQLGDGGTKASYTPVQVKGLTGATAIAAGDWHTVALRNDGTVWAWGSNAAGQLGDGGITKASYTPVQASGLTGVTAIAGRTTYTVALKNDGTVWAWGDNQNGLWGDVSWPESYTPVQVKLADGTYFTGVTAIAAGDSHTVALSTHSPLTPTPTPAPTPTPTPTCNSALECYYQYVASHTPTPAPTSTSTPTSTSAPTSTPAPTSTSTPTSTPTPTSPAQALNIPTAAIPTIITLQGKFTDSDGNPVQTGSMKVMIKDSTGAQVWQETFNDVIDNGVFNIPLGAVQELRLVPSSIYSMEVAIDADSRKFATVDVTFGDNNPAGDVIKFKA